MRLNPFTMWWEHRKNQKAFMLMSSKVGEDMRTLIERLDKAEREIIALGTLSTMTNARITGLTGKVQAMAQDAITQDLIRKG